MSNWGGSILSNSQLIYAANDAFAALCIYLALSEDPDMITLMNIA